MEVPIMKKEDIKKVVLAYSGGLDTSIIIPWLKENYNNCEVIAVSGNVGQADELDGLEEKAIKTGASKLYVLDLTDEYVDDYIIPTMQAGAMYEEYLLGTSHARPCIAKGLVEIAQKEGVALEHSAGLLIGKLADGGMRDALSIFDQVVSFTGGNITYKSVIENLNVLDYEYYFKLTDLLLENKVPESMLLFNDVLKKGFDGSHFITGLSSHFRDLLVSKDPSTLQLLEVGAGIRDRYKEQAQKCDQKFLYRAMKLCNDCDLNYRASKNKRLLVELTLIQCAQLTLPDADDASGGRGPKKILKPLFTQQAASTDATQSQPQAKTAAAQTAATAAPQLQGTSTAGSMNANRPSPLPQTREEKKIPVFKAGSLGISLRRPLHEQQAAEKQEAKAASTAVQNDATYEDYIFNEKDLDYYWREFAAALPKEEKANSARMMNMHPHLLNDTTFEVTVDNDMVEKYMVQLIPSVQNHLRERLHNRKITMTVRVSAPTENIRAYSHVERFQMMSKKNPNLLKLKEALGLELS